MRNILGDNRYFRAWALLVLRFRWLALAATLLITVGAGLLAVNLRFDNSTEYFASGNSEAQAVLDEYRADFGRDSLYLVMVEGDVFSMPFLERLQALHDDLERLEVEGLQAAPAAEGDDPFADLGDFGDFGDLAWGEAGGTVVEEVRSLVNARQTLSSAGGIQVRGLLDEWPEPEELPALRQLVLGDVSFVGEVVGGEGRHAVLAVRTRMLDHEERPPVLEAIQAVAEAHDAEGFKVWVTGMPVLDHVLNSLVLHDTQRLVGVAFLVMMLVLFYLYRHPLGVLGPLVVVALSSVWMLGAMAAIDMPFTLISNILPAFLACVGMADSIHVQSVYRDGRERGLDNHEAIVHAIASTGVPILLTTLTTMAGLLSFRLASTQAIQEMGTAGAFGVALAMLHSMVLLPVVLSFIGRSRFAEASRKKDGIDHMLAGLTAASSKPGKRYLTLGLGVVATAVALVGVSKLEVYHNPLSWLGDAHPTTIELMTMDQEVGGVATMHVVIEAKGEHGVRDLDLLRGLEAFDAHLHTLTDQRTGEPVVTGSVSLLDVIRETHRALHQGDEAAYVLPDSQRAVSDALFLFENAGPDQLRRLVTADFSKTHLTARVHWTDASSYLPMIEHVQAGIDAHFEGVEATVRPTGTTYHVAGVVGALIRDLLRSFSVAVLAITLMMLILLRQVRLGLVSMVPNLLPIAFVLGLMGYVGIPIDLSNLLIASIVLGIAVDDTIHYLHQFRVGYTATGDVEVGIAQALSHAGRALVSTTVVLTLGFSVYIFSYLGNLQRFGVLVGLACVLALLIDLLFAPALLRTLYSRKSSKEVRDDPRQVA